jgi:hypothetical protein
MEFTVLKIYHVSSVQSVYDGSEARSYVGDVHIPSSIKNEHKLELAYAKAQNHHPDWSSNNVRSTMVGDMIELNNEFYIVEPIGFKKHEKTNNQQFHQ